MGKACHWRGLGCSRGHAASSGAPQGRILLVQDWCLCYSDAGVGESPKTVQTMLGHSCVAITLDIYSHVSLELEKKAATKLNAA